jgi:hypothetical protein
MSNTDFAVHAMRQQARAVCRSAKPSIEIPNFIYSRERIVHTLLQCILVSEIRRTGLQSVGEIS